MKNEENILKRGTFTKRMDNIKKKSMGLILKVGVLLYL